MKKAKKTLALFFIAVTPTIVSYAQSKFDASTRMFLSQYEMSQINPKAILPIEGIAPMVTRSIENPNASVTVFVTIAPGYTAADIEKEGFTVTTDTGADIVLAQGPIDKLAALEHSEAVKALSMGQMRNPLLNRARVATGIDKIHTGEGILSPYTGKGVIAGIFDTGVDPNHINFKNDDGTTRIGRLWYYYTTNGSAKQYDTNQQIANFYTDNRNQTHGTHTLGCLTGSYSANGYHGMAPDAIPAVGCGSLYDANIVAAVSNIVDYAKETGHPAVVSLSIGSNIGPHDGSDATSKMLATLGEEAIICIAAGNEGSEKMSFIHHFEGNDTTMRTFLYSPTDFSGAVDIWSDDYTPFTLTPFIYDLTTGTTTYQYPIEGGSDQSVTLASTYFTSPTYIHSTEFDDAFATSYLATTTSTNTTTNFRYNTLSELRICYNTSTNADHKKVLGFMITAPSGTTVRGTTSSATAEFTSLDQPGFVDGTAQFSINSLACGENVISVGAWNSQNTWPVATGGEMTYASPEGYEVGEVAGYSSYGYMPDGRTLPTVCAPGTAIVSSISTAYYNLTYAYGTDLSGKITTSFNDGKRDNYWMSMQGTSMATPIAAGSIALWLEADNTLNYYDIKTLIEATAKKKASAPAITTQSVTAEDATDPARWGEGQIDALAGIKRILARRTSYGADVETDPIVTRTGTDTYDIFIADAKTVDLTVYTLSGNTAMHTTTDGQQAYLNTESLANGIYILKANGYTTKIAVK